MEQDIVFDFEKAIQEDFKDDQARRPPVLPSGEIGQQPRNFVKNYKKTVCAFWIKGMCMKGDNCGFLHEMIPERMPECQMFLRKGVCTDPDCKFKHSREGILECNMYALGFCIFGPECRYKHTKRPGPPPDPRSVEAAKPKNFRDINRVVNTVNKSVATDLPQSKRQRLQTPGPPHGGGKPNQQLPGPRPPSSAPSQPSAPLGPPPGPPQGVSGPQPPSGGPRPPPGPHMHQFGGGGGPSFSEHPFGGGPPMGPLLGGPMHMDMMHPMHMNPFMAGRGGMGPARGRGFGFGGRGRGGRGGGLSGQLPDPFAGGFDGPGPGGPFRF